MQHDRAYLLAKHNTSGKLPPAPPAGQPSGGIYQVILVVHLYLVAVRSTLKKSILLPGEIVTSP